MMSKSKTVPGQWLVNWLPLVLLLSLGTVVVALAEGGEREVAATESGFVSVASRVLSANGGNSRGVAWGDFNGDGWDDLVVANAADGQRNFLYRNRGDGTLELVEDSPVVTGAAPTEGVNWVDFDNDGDVDLLVVNRSETSNELFRNDGDGGLVRVSGGDLTADRTSSTTACWADYDEDGFLDVWVVNRDGEDDALYRNRSGGGFSRVAAGPMVGRGGDGRTCAWGDVDADGDLDLYVGNFLTADREGKATNFLYLNRGDGAFESVIEGPAVSDPGLTYGVSWVDFDNDGDLDLFVSNIARSDQNALYRNDGSGQLAKVTVGPLVTDSGGPSKGHTWGDYDNDGDLDLYVANGTEGTDDILGYFYRHLGGGRFERVLESPFDSDRHISAGTAWGDYDNNGDLDIFVANWRGDGEANDLYRNQTSGASWLALRLEGRQSNRMGIGAKVRLVVEMEGETNTQYRWQLLNTGYGSQNAPIIHFGLGSATVARTLEISWPSGKVDTHSNVDANRFWHAVEGSDLTPDPKKMISMNQAQALEAAGLRAGRSGLRAARTPATSNVNLKGRSHQ
jgi:hypothetical protein